MFGKPPITALQEYCAKKSFALPTYQFVDSEGGAGATSFVCQVEALNMAEYGYGRSKREAKHDAAAKLIKKIRPMYPDIEDIPQAKHEATPTSDAVITLRDYCVKNDHPLPAFDIIQQAGPAEAPEYTAQCVLASIKRYGVANNKKAAKQKAALEILRVIKVVDIQQTQVVSVETQLKDSEEKRLLKFKTYRELTESQSGHIPGTKLSDRHKYFTKFFDNLKNEAKNVLKSSYDSDKEKVMHLFKALQIEPTIKTLPTKISSNNLFIELNCDYDVVFAGSENKIYADILVYFKDMLDN